MDRPWYQMYEDLIFVENETKELVNKWKEKLINREQTTTEQLKPG